MDSENDLRGSSLKGEEEEKGKTKDNNNLKESSPRFKFWEVSEEERLKYKADLKANAVQVEFNPTNNPT